ncbi:aspartate-alanine antiporter [Achromobacter denitrificans]|uniref:Aspartate-alanine antiporter n=1 Tax=Achromobacter denitrificans TaxID=32002 RepID=A0A427WZX0_ACHDE|nr:MULTISPECIES: aspartate-alanine antiporter [Achromobacter]ASC64571.1 aspartate-alanine antiporter [Achromobacter denitrificans]MBV2160550.1 aspartate-alanine antiporter [Achromobacter denitrificans]MDF3852190.1 aspartate-alanine antiporter [Achromobacter denitrificans]MDF3858236.1 aspartate-alanine antiporter [Achromobacter denitrificans]MDF3940079.1 aspartate-alanine antiporter [Achromobacter denitrificans]
MTWFVSTLKAYPEIAIFLALGIGYWIGGKSFKGFSLGAVTSTLLVAIVIGILGVKISPNVKSVFFLMFLFAVGYGVGPQFVRGIAKDGLPQAIFAVIMALLSLGAAVVAAMIAGYDLGSAAGLFAGSQTISASMGLATDAINRLARSPAETQELLDAMPIAYAVTYIFGTVGSAIILAQIGPKLLGIDLVAACKAYEQKLGAGQGPADGTHWYEFELRAYSVAEHSPFIGKTVAELEGGTQAGFRAFIERIRRGGKIIEVDQATVIEPGDIVAIGGKRDQLIARLGPSGREVEDAELLDIKTEGVDIYVSNKKVDGKPLEELAHWPGARGVFLKKIRRGPTETVIPILPKTELFRGDVITVVGRTQDINAAAQNLGYVDRPTTVTDVAFVSLAITIGALIGAIVINVSGIPLTISTAGGSLIAGIIFGWFRAIHPTFGRIPEPTLWFMNSVGLNVFIAVVGISAGPGFVAGLQKLGISLFLWGIFATAVPLVLGMLIAKYVFRFDPALILGICAGSRTTTAALGMVCEEAKSQVPGLGYTVTYAVGNTLLTIWGMVVIMILS